MAITGLSEIMTKRVEFITEEHNPFVYKLDVTLSSVNNDVLVKQPIVERIDVHQNFIGNYMDFVNLTIQLTPSEYLQIMQNSQDLKCLVKFKKYDHKKQQDMGGQPFIIQNLAIIQDKEGLLKKYPLGDVMTKKGGLEQEQHHAIRIPVNIQMIDPWVYLMRIYIVIFIGRQVKQWDVILALLDQFGVKTASVVAPDNQRTYENYVVPPMLGMEDAFRYIQEFSGKGVYYKGFNYYYTNETMFIYPTFETRPTSPTTVFLYNIGASRLHGLDIYSRVKDGNTHVLINTDVGGKDLLDSGMENIGNSINAQQSEQLIDTVRTMKEDGTYDVNLETNISRYDMDPGKNKGVTKDAFKSTFVFSKDNDYILTSKLAASNLNMVRMVWNHATLDTFKPGWAVRYCYDDSRNSTDNTPIFSTRYGVCMSSTYSFKKAGAIAVDQLFGCTCDIALFLDVQDD